MLFPFFYAGKIVEIIRFTACKNLRDSLYCCYLSCDSQPMGLMWRSIEHMKEKLHFHPYYFIATVLLFLIEVLIAIYVDDAIIRPHGGDYLVVILLF
jgi:hypothetical protein